MRTTTFVLIILAIIGIQSCGGSAGSLARDLEGSWTTTAEQLDVPGATSSIAIYTYDFARTDGQNGGTVSLTAMLEVSRPVTPPSAPAGASVRCSATGVATIQGTWRATGDDEIFMMLDPKSIKVTVDESALDLDYSALAPDSVPAPETFMPGLPELLKQEMTSAVERKILAVHHLDDVKAQPRKGMLTWEVNDVDYHLARQPQ